MKTTKYRIIGRTNGYIANRDIHFNGKTMIVIDQNLSLREAQEKLLDMYNEMYDSEIGMPRKNWGLVRCNDPYRTSTYKDGTRSFEYDSRYYSIEEDNSVHPEDVCFNFKGAFLMWKDNDGNRYYAHLGEDYLDKSEEVRPIFTQALNKCLEDGDPVDGDPVVSIENYLEEHGYPIPVTFTLG